MREEPELLPLPTVGSVCGYLSVGFGEDHLGEPEVQSVSSDECRHEDSEDPRAESVQEGYHRSKEDDKDESEDERECAHCSLCLWFGGACAPPPLVSCRRMTS